MATPLQSGYNVIINQKIGSTNTPIYPFTKTANVVDANGKSIDEIVAGLAAKEHGNHVPDFTAETASSLRFLRNDNTWADIQAASTTQAGVVQLSEALDSADATVAATASAVKAVKDAVDELASKTDEDFVKAEKLGVANGVATLDENGLVPSTQLPSYVDDVVEMQMSEDGTVTGVDTPESGKIYVDTVTGKTYRWSGSMYVEISESLALGDTASTAFDGARGLIAYNHSQAAHARVDATKTEASEQNGFVKIDGTDVKVYEHPTVEGGTATNPHGTTAADVGLGNVENKDSATIRGELTKENVTNALGFTPSDNSVLATAANDGVMSAAYAAKLDNCMQTAVSTEAPAFEGDGLWFQIVQ